MGPQTFLIIAIAVLALLDSARAQMVCSTSILDQSVRQVILNLHNHLRKRVAVGVARPAPRGQNIYALTYNCSLEQSAQTTAEKCTGMNSSPSERPNVGENVYAYSGAAVKAAAFAHAIVSWQNPSGWTGNVFTAAMNTSGLRNFAQMAWGSTTLIGCGYQQCTSFQSVVCHYMTEGAKVNEVAYHLGRGCIRDQECTTFASSTCDKGLRLCRAPAGVSLPPTGGSVIGTTASTQSTDCPTSPLNANIRNAILNRHNRLRSQVARMRQIPEQPHKRGSNRMFALRYNCALEVRANRIADLCPPAPAQDAAPTRGQNLHSDNTEPAASIGGSVAAAITAWINQGRVFSDGVKLGTAPNALPAVGYFAQMVNARTYEIGCGYGSCAENRKVVLCIYKSARSDNGLPYNAITTSRGCTLAGCQATFPNATCNATSGLCQLP